MNDIYRGFEVVRTNGLFQIKESGRLIDDAASETAAYDRIDKILRGRVDKMLLDRRAARAM